MYVELFTAFVALLLWNPTSLQLSDRLCVDIVLLAGLNTVLFNANPLMRFDGYYLLADLVGIPNLSMESRRYLTNVAKFWFRGVEVPPVRDTRWNKRIIAGYAYASSVWRCLTFSGIALSLIARYSWWGAALSLVVAWYWFGLKIPDWKKSSNDRSVRSSGGIRRQRAACGVIGLALLFLGIWLASPANVSAPGVVEYAPLTVMRAPAGGFVTAVYVHEGEAVAEGALLLELRNDDLGSNMKRIEVELAQAEQRARSFLTVGDLAKQQKELASVESLEKQREELRSRRDGLQVRAPRLGTVATREVEGLVGRYVEQGEVLLLLGNEDEKELLVSAATSDEKEFVAHLDEPVTILRQSQSDGTKVGSLTHVDPRAGETLPHAALGADSGGDVTVKLQRQERDEMGQTPCLSLMPRVVAKVSLDAETSRDLRAGQRVVVCLTGMRQTWAERILARWQDYLVEVAARAEGTAGG
jgi:putative peptide zinc metalloprotease protein